MLKFKDGGKPRKYNSKILSEIMTQPKQTSAIEKKQSPVKYFAQKESEITIDFIEGKLTPIQYAVKKMELIRECLELEKENIKEELISFQLYLHDEGHIENHDWDFEKEAIVYVNIK